MYRQYFYIGFEFPHPPKLTPTTSAELCVKDNSALNSTWTYTCRYCISLHFLVPDDVMFRNSINPTIWAVPTIPLLSFQRAALTLGTVVWSVIHVQKTLGTRLHLWRTHSKQQTRLSTVGTVLMIFLCCHFPWTRSLSTVTTLYICLAKLRYLLCKETDLEKVSTALAGNPSGLAFLPFLRRLSVLYFSVRRPFF